jgi:alpha-tubulin suppressor-like RCC1 family protein
MRAHIARIHWYCLLSGLAIFIWASYAGTAGCEEGKSTFSIGRKGTVWVWGGDNEYGLCGDGTTNPIREPRKVQKLANAKAVACGDNFSMALMDDGTVCTWGHNLFGQLGDGTNYNSTEPKQVPRLSHITAIGAGHSHALALQDDGRVWAWGWNYFGQLGDGTYEDRHSPVVVMENAKAIAGGRTHSLAVKSDGTVWAWGRNGYGQLGDKTYIDRPKPNKVPLLSDAVSVAAGNHHSLALVADGTVYAWGDNSSCQIGDGSGSDRNAPVAVLKSAKAIQAGATFSVALDKEGDVWTWGDGFWGQTATGRFFEFQPIPFELQQISGVTNIAAGYSHVLALTKEDIVYAWGNNFFGKLGDGTINKSCFPLVVSRIRNIKAIAAGGNHSLAVMR